MEDVTDDDIAAFIEERETGETGRFLESPDDRRNVP